jgi:hypothetical protein
VAGGAAFRVYPNKNITRIQIVFVMLRCLTHFRQLVF